ncbi:hypothetical protein NS206_11955 [Microbacterium testaceum]|uniref:hypothetical protein n=1 Tax=Microbacterium testaceum TaxID=2033 RepID=UPI000733E165|nr:hypothetical protein [Microbacterium testaceum]KTS60175.1 hypothetical protein NS206_11955 [Microbacterium testaceum]KTS84392.1 hypothetical protein NS183_14230 [Microbacterium testaceum]
MTQATAERFSVGPWEFDLTPTGDLAHVSYAGIEVARGIQFVVRDDAWGTIVGDRDVRVTRRSDREVVVEMRSRHDFPSGAVEATTRIRVGGDRLRYSADAVVDGAVETNRVGLVVLHPLTQAGAEVDLTHAEGTRSRSRFPEHVSPHQPWSAITGLALDVADGCRLHIALEGDVFETEDQRNWSDASFKTYSRPLALPYPYRLEAGEWVRQAVDLRVTGTRATGAVDPGPVPFEPFAIRSDRSAPRPRPSLGVQLGPRDADLGADEVRSRVERLGVDHVRVDVVCENGGARGLEQLDACEDLPLELALHLGDDSDAALRAVRERLARRHAALRAVLVFSLEAPVTPSGAAVLVRRALSDELVGAVVIVGTDDNLAELNRGEPDPVDADEVTFSLTPQVHDGFERSIIETTEAVPAMIDTARRLGGGRPVGIGALTLRPRRSLYRQGHRIDRLDRDPESVDPRQHDDFAASWLLATLATLAAEDVSRVTTLEVSGPRGVTDAGTARLTPSGEVIAAVAASATIGTPILDLRAGLVALPVESGTLVGDLSGRARHGEVDGVDVDLSPYAVRLVTPFSAPDPKASS